MGAPQYGVSNSTKLIHDTLQYFVTFLSNLRETVDQGFYVFSFYLVVIVMLVLVGHFYLAVTMSLDLR